jgi:mannitol/fructose-specific phosphotransferase system IIA component
MPISLPGRPDPYGLIHRALRLLLAQVVEQATAADWRDATAAARATAAIARALDLLDEHADVEDTYLAALIARTAPALAAGIAADHAGLRARHRAVRDVIAGAPDRDAVTGPLLALVEAEFRHMRREELEVLARLHAAVADDELVAAIAAIRASRPPERAMAVLEIMVPVMSAAERELLIDGLPPAARAAIEPLLARHPVIPHVEESLALRYDAPSG